MTTTEKWNEICDYFESHNPCEENAIQSLWEKLFAEIFGYSSLKNEIDTHRKLQLGSTERLIPDIIIKKSETDLFVVELKQESLSIDTARKSQLFSYLKQLRVDLGILICNQIAIFDYDYNKPDAEQAFVTIDFEKDNPRGIKFVELFSKESFVKDAVKDFIGKYSSAEKNISAIKQELNAELLKNLVTKYFSEKYSAEETEDALKDYVFEVNKKMAVPKIVGVTPFGGHTEVTKRIGGKIKHLADKITKNEAINLFRQNGLEIYGNITFASQNEGAPKYWANPDVHFLQQDWWIILSDVDKHTVHAFFIPANTISKDKMKFKNPKQMDLQIYYDDDKFQDSRSGIYFYQWLKKSITF